MLLQRSCFPLREKSAGRAVCILRAFSDTKTASPRPRPQQALFFSPFSSQEDLTLSLILGWCLALKGKGQTIPCRINRALHRHFTERRELRISQVHLKDAFLKPHLSSPHLWQVLLTLPQGGGILLSNPTSVSIGTPGTRCEQHALPAQHPGARSQRGADFSFA